MIVFNTFLKVLNKCKVPIIMYTIILIVFGGLNMKTNNTTKNFTSEKPDILIINKDTNNKLSQNLVNYIKKNSNIVKIENTKDKIEDALFYRDVNYIIYIPTNYGNDITNGKNPKIDIKSTKDYNASYAEMILSRYLKTQNTYKNEIKNEDKLINKINSTITKKVEVKMTSKINTTNINKTTTYYNFLSYSILAGAIYVVCLILSSFGEENIKKRIIISSMNYKKHNRLLLLSNGLFIIVLWLFYILLSIVLLKDAMFTPQGLIYAINALIFSICALSIAFLINNLINNKSAINGIINVIALGSSFLCGAFVPVEYLPDFVLKIAHILPSYWYINTNESLKTIEIFDISTIKPILVNMIILVIYTIVFVIISNIISKRKRKIG